MLGKSMWVSCDGEPGFECDEEIVGTGREATVRWVRAKARRRGWKYDATRDLDLCPEHTGWLEKR